MTSGGVTNTAGVAGYSLDATLAFMKTEDRLRFAEALKEPEKKISPAEQRRRAAEKANVDGWLALHERYQREAEAKKQKQLAVQARVKHGEDREQILLQFKVTPAERDRLMGARSWKELELLPKAISALRVLQG